MFKKGYKMSEEHKRKIADANRISLKGNKNHLGHFHNEEIRKKISLNVKGKLLGKPKPPRTAQHIKSLKLAWAKRKEEGYKPKPFSDETKRKIGLSNKGKIHSEETRKKIGLKSKGHKVSEETRKKMSKSKKGIIPKNILRGDFKGEKNNSWKGGITPLYAKIRNSAEYATWRKLVFARDNYTCVWCGDSRGGNLNADHIKPFSLYPDLRLALDNGRTLCEDCHKKTDTFGKKMISYERELFKSFK